MATAAVRVTRDEQVRRNRGVVLDAALGVFRERGYAGATLDAVGAAAGFSRGVTYSQFASKADLFLAALERRRDARAVEQRTLVDGLDRAESWDALVDLLIDAQDRDPAWILVSIEFRVVAARDPGLRERYRVLHQVTLDELAAVLGRLYERTGVEPPAAPADLAVQVAAFGYGVSLEHAGGAGMGRPSLAAALQRLLGVPG
jgi:AcrR family transcriptional regulator